MAAMELFSWLTFLILIFALILGRIKGKAQKWSWTGLELPLFGFVLFAALGAVFIEDISSDQRRYILGSQRWIVLFYTYYLIFTNKWVSLNRVFYVVVGAATLVSLYAIFQTFTGWDVFRSVPYKATPFSSLNIWRAKGFFSNSITYANSFSLVALLLVGVLLQSKNELSKKKQSLYWTALVIISLSILFSFTRGVWVGVFVATLIMAALKGKKVFTKIVLLFCLIFITAFSFFTLLFVNVYLKQVCLEIIPA